MRDVIYNLFSADQRGGGTRICSQTLFELDPEIVGFRASHSPHREQLFRDNVEMGGVVFDNTFRLSGYHVKIGSPYSGIMIRVTGAVADAIDRASANLSIEVKRREKNGESIDVEELTRWCSSRLSSLVSDDNAGGRLISKVDFFLYPPASLRAAALEKGCVDAGLAADLRSALQSGQYLVTAFDVSGGAAGVGMSEVLARHWGIESSGLLAAYADGLLDAYRRGNDRPPDQIVIMPDEESLASFGATEFVPLWKMLQDRGHRSYIVTSGAYESALSENPDLVRLRSIDGRAIRVGGNDTTLIVRRYHYLYEERGTSRGIIPRHPPGTTVLPNDASRIIASDCRIKFRVVEQAAGHEEGFRAIPCLFLKLEDSRSPSYVPDFLSSCAEEWPEVRYLGGIMKPVDKIPPSEAGRVLPVLPIPPIPMNRRILETMVTPPFENLLSKGVDEIVVMPNVLPLVVDQDHSLLPKTEVRVIAIRA